MGYQWEHDPLNPVNRAARQRTADIWDALVDVRLDRGDMKGAILAAQSRDAYRPIGGLCEPYNQDSLC
jgi:hypothetical protein